jgi:hypothetical protein
VAAAPKSESRITRDKTRACALDAQKRPVDQLSAAEEHGRRERRCQDHRPSERPDVDGAAAHGPQKKRKGEPSDQVVDHRRGHDHQPDVRLEEPEVEQSLGDHGQCRDAQRHAQKERHRQASSGVDQVRCRQQQTEKDPAGRREKDPEEPREQGASSTPPEHVEIDFQPDHDEQQDDRDRRVRADHRLGRAAWKHPGLHPGRHVAEHGLSEKNPGGNLSDHERQPQEARQLAQKAG